MKKPQPPGFITLRVPTFPRIDEYVGVWAMEPTAFAAAADKLRNMDLAAHMAEQAPAPRSQIQKRPTPNGKTIAIISVLGTLMKQQSSVGEASSTIQLRKDIRSAAADSDVAAILLAFDSPGGSVAGTDDLAAEVAAARKAKPVWAHVDDLCASAAYWVASQCEKIFANSATALVGSIGTFLGVYDFSGAAEKEGVKALMFSTGPLKGAAALPGTPVTEEQAAYFQSIVDQQQKSFDEGVRKGRGFNAKQLADVRSGAVFTATEAISKKLIDGIQSIEQTIADLSKAARPRAGGPTSHNLGGQPPVHPVEAKAMNFESWAAVKGFDLTTVGELATASLRSQFEAEARAASKPATDPIAEYRQQQAAESTRVAEIRRVCAAAGGQSAVEAQAIAEGWDVPRADMAAQLAQLRTQRPTPNVITGGTRPAGVTESSVVEAALCMSLGSKNVEKQFKPEVLEVAHKSFRHLGLQQAIMMVAASNGYSCSPGERINQGNLRDVLAYAFPRGGPGGGGTQAGFSTLSLPGILGAVANKEILAGYMEEDQTWREIAQIKPVNNFHAVTSYRMLDDMEYEEVGAGGEIKHGSVGEESYTRQAKTYAKMFSLTRTHMINDDLGAFGDLKNRLGRGSSQKFNKIFWTAFLNNASFFTSGRGNYLVGASTPLSFAALTSGVEKFRKLQSGTADAAKRIGGRPELLLVPPETEGVADQLYVSTNVNSGGAATTAEIPNGNTHRNKYRPVVVPWLSDTSISGYSTVAWYLFRNPGVMAAMVVSFLNGMQTPTVESTDADFNTLGVDFRGYHDWGCDLADYLAGIKVKGAA